MNGSMRKPAMIEPLTKPIKPPAPTVSKTTSHGGTFFKASVAPSTPVSATTEPTLRSIPALTMIIVMPNPQIATMTVCVRMILKFAPVRK